MRVPKNLAMPFFYVGLYCGFELNGKNDFYYNDNSSNTEKIGFVSPDI